MRDEPTAVPDGIDSFKVTPRVGGLMLRLAARGEWFEFPTTSLKALQIAAALVDSVAADADPHGGR